MDSLVSRLRLGPRDAGQQLRARITEKIKPVSPDLRRHAAKVIGLPGCNGRGQKGVADHRPQLTSSARALRLAEMSST